MKTFNLTLKMLLFVSVLALWSSCSKNEALEDIEIPTPINPSDDNKDDQFMVVCEHVCDVHKEIKKVFSSCNNISDLIQYAERFKKLDHVEDVYSTNTTMYVQIKDFGLISFSFYPETEKLPAKVHDRIKYSQAKRVNKNSNNNEEHPLLDLENAVIINQVYNDERFKVDIDIASETKKILESCGVKTTIVNNPKKEFFIEDIFNYDIVFLDTHGGWDPKNKIHWLLTSEKPSGKEVEDFVADDLYKYKGIPRDQVSINTVKEVHKGDTVDVSYVEISEKYIASSSKSFKKRGKTIFFNAACMSMMGGDDRVIHNSDGSYSYTDTNTRNKSLALTLKEKGMGFYLGYDQSAAGGMISGLIFFAHLASGMEITNAYELLAYELLHEDKETVERTKFGDDIYYRYTSDLVPLYSDENVGIGRSCLTTTALSEIKDNSSINTINYTLEAISPAYFTTNTNYASGIEKCYDYYFNWINFYYGFEICESEDFTNDTKVYKMALDDNGCPFPDRVNKVTFTKILSDKDLKPSTTYYYKAFFYDGVETYYTKPLKFTTISISTNGGITLPDVPGSNF